MKKLFIVIILLFLGVYFLFFQKGNVKGEYDLKLYSQQDIASVVDSLYQNDAIQNRYIFDLMRMFYSVKSVPAGYYRFESSMTSLDILRKLKYGRQDPVKFTLSTATFIQEVAKRAGSKMLFDSATFMDVLLNKHNQDKYGYDSLSCLSLFIPNTIEMYWNISPQVFIERWGKEYEKFWNEDNKKKSESLQLTPAQVYTLASLVQKEYNKKEERAKIAGVLINRLRMNMPLQVDATCKYATGDFTAKRVLNYHTSFPSPYNTYLNRGLPPGPICMPEKSTIEAVLEPEKHDFIYYCADPSLNGYHVFSKTLSEHESVATLYRQKMNQIGIK